MAQTRFVSSGRYRETEVRALLEEYADALERRDTDEAGLSALIAVADLKRAWAKLNREERKVVLASGVLGLSSREAGAVLEKSHVWTQKHYKASVEDLTWLMNGGIL